MGLAFEQAFFRSGELVDVAGSVSVGGAVCAPAQLSIAISAKRGRAVNSGPSGPSGASRAAALLTARPRAATRPARHYGPARRLGLGECAPGDAAPQHRLRRPSGGRAEHRARRRWAAPRAPSAALLVVLVR